MTAPILRSPARAAPQPPAAGTGRAVWMDSLRGLAIVLVVAYHAKTVLGRFVPDVPDALGLAQELFEPFRMPLLIFLSGMLLTRSLAKPARVFFSGKLRRIAWPYAVWSVLFLFVSEQASPERLLRLAVDPPNYLWYLWYLVFYYAIVFVAQAVRVPVLLLAPAALLASAFIDLYGVRRFLFLLALFAAGHLLSLHGSRLRLGPRWPWVGICSAVAVPGSLLSASGVQIRYEAEWVVVPAAGIALCLLLAPTHTEGRSARLLRHVGRHSLVFYVAHYPVLWVVQSALPAVGVQEPLLVYAVGLVVALAAGVALVRLRPRSPAVDVLFELPARTRRTTPPAADVDRDDTRTQER